MKYYKIVNILGDKQVANRSLPKNETNPSIGKKKKQDVQIKLTGSKTSEVIHTKETASARIYK